MRACSAGKSSAQSGSNSTRARRTSFSVMPVWDFRAARQVWTTAREALGQDYGNKTIDDLLTEMQLGGPH